MSDTILIIIALICFTVIVVSQIVSNHKIKKSQSLFRMQILEARASIKERAEYERRLNNLGVEIDQSQQVKTLAHIYELLNRSAVEYDQNPKAFPSPIQEALLKISYNYTIIKNE